MNDLLKKNLFIIAGIVTVLAVALGVMYLVQKITVPEEPTPEELFEQEKQRTIEKLKTLRDVTPEEREQAISEVLGNREVTDEEKQQALRVLHAQ